MHCKNNTVFNGQLIPQMTSSPAVFAEKKIIQKKPTASAFRTFSFTIFYWFYIFLLRVCLWDCYEQDYNKQPAVNIYCFLKSSEFPDFLEMK